MKAHPFSTVLLNLVSCAFHQSNLSASDPTLLVILQNITSCLRIPVFLPNTTPGGKKNTRKLYLFMNSFLFIFKAKLSFVSALIAKLFLQCRDFFLWVCWRNIFPLYDESSGLFSRPENTTKTVHSWSAKRTRSCFTKSLRSCGVISRHGTIPMVQLLLHSFSIATL